MEIYDDFYNKKKENLRFAVIFALIFIAILFALLCLAFNADAAEITDEKAVHCILGEARGEGYESMLAHAEAIRNRGHLGGVYGCRAEFSKEMPYLENKGIIRQAQKAWHQSKNTKTVKGASFWGSTIIDGEWIEKMERSGFRRTAVIGNTAFYRK